MKRRGLLGILTLSAMIGGTAASHAQTSDTGNVKLVTTGEIRKIDEKNKTFQFKFKFNLDPPTSLSRSRATSGGGRPGGIGGRRRGGLGYPGRNRYPAPTAAADNSKEVKVFTSASTTLKDTSAQLHFSDLKKGDRVTITAIHTGKGDDIDALVVKRD